MTADKPYPCAARPGTEFVHVDGPCQCFIGGASPEFPNPPDAEPEEKKRPALRDKEDAPHRSKGPLAPRTKDKYRIRLR